MEVQQDENEFPDAFMEGNRILTQDAFRKTDEEQQILAVTAICKGLRNRQVAAMVSAQAKDSIAVGVACETESNLERHFQHSGSYRPYGLPKESYRQTGLTVF